MNPLFILAALGGAYIVGDKLLKAVGLSKSKEDKERAAALTIMENWPEWQGKAYVLALPKTKIEELKKWFLQGKKIAMRIHDSKGIISNEPEELYGAYREVLSKAHLAYLAYIFIQLYNKDLLAYTVGALGGNEKRGVALYNILKNKPDWPKQAKK